MKFAQDATEPAFAPREVVLAGKAARMLAREVLAMDQEGARDAAALVGRTTRSALNRGIGRGR